MLKLEGTIFCFAFNGSQSRVRTGQIAGLGAPHHLGSSAVWRRDPMFGKEGLRGCIFFFFQDEQGFLKASNAFSQWTEVFSN